jgi:hypothetical protein
MTTLAVTSVGSLLCQVSTCLRMGSVSLHPIHTDSDAVDQRKRLRMFREHWREHAWYKVAKFEGLRA